MLAYLSDLSSKYKIILITYEKPEDWIDKAAMDSMYKYCNDNGIRWLPQKFRSKPKLLAPLLSMIRMVWLSLTEVKRNNVKLIHSRSYIPSRVALTVNRIMGIPFIFDMRALWPEELIAAGRLRQGSLIHKVIVRMEKNCLQKSAAVVSLTNAAQNYLKKKYQVELDKKPIVVIPTCADLDKFHPAKDKKAGPFIHGCVGTLSSGWFRIDMLANWIKVASLNNPNAIFEIVTRDNAKSVRNFLDPKNEYIERLKITSRSPEEMPKITRLHDLSIMFFTSGISKLGSAPTRLAEALGSGLPVLANDGVGDLANIIQTNNVGIVLESDSLDDMQTAYEDLQFLLQDPDLSRRCRMVAENIFSLKTGVKLYSDLYEQVMKENNPSCVA